MSDSFVFSEDDFITTISEDDLKEKTKLDLNVSYPYDTEYEYKTLLERLNLDEERRNDIMTDKGFIVSPTRGVAKDVKDPFSIFSSK